MPLFITRNPNQDWSVPLFGAFIIPNSNEVMVSLPLRRTLGLAYVYAEAAAIERDTPLPDGLAIDALIRLEQRGIFTVSESDLEVTVTNKAQRGLKLAQTCFPQTVAAAWTNKLPSAAEGGTALR